MDRFLNKYWEVCLDCNGPLRRRVRELEQEDFNLESFETIATIGYGISLIRMM